MTQIAAVPGMPAGGMELSVSAGDRTVTRGVHDALTAVLAKPRTRPAAGQVTAADFARQVQWSEGYVSQYRNAGAGDVLPFDVRAFEGAAEQWLAAREVAAADDAAAEGYMETPVSTGIATFIREIERMQSCGVILGDAGIGKSCALKLWRKGNPRAVLVTVSSWCCGTGALGTAIFRAIGMRDGKRATGSRLERVAKELAARPRTLVFDNAHQLSPGALRLLFNLNDQNADGDRPQSALVLCGNPEIEDKLRANDQFRSRLARVYDANKVASGDEAKRRFAAPLVSRMAGRLLPDLSDADRGAVIAAGVQLARKAGGGRFRAVDRALRYTRDIVAARSDLAPVAAFESAYATLSLAD